MGSKRALVVVVGVLSAPAVLGTQSTYAQAVRDPCALLTQAQVSSALGAKVGAGQPIGTTGCQWSTPEEPNAKSGKVTVTLSLWGERAFSKTPIGPGITMTPVGGIGDDAVFSTVSNLTTLSVKKGKSTLLLRVYGVHDQRKQEAMEKSLATDVLARW